MMDSLVVGFTGHRPPKTGLTYSHSGEADRAAVATVRGFLVDMGAGLGVVGGALGFDTLAARACYLEKVPYDVYVPFVGQESKWPTEAQIRYRKMLELANDVRVVSPGGYQRISMQLRNEAMVDASDVLAAWWDGSAGGTANCVRYAERQIGMPIYNLYQEVRHGNQ